MQHPGRRVRSTRHDMRIRRLGARGLFGCNTRAWRPYRRFRREAAPSSEGFDWPALMRYGAEFRACDVRDLSVHPGLRGCAVRRQDVHGRRFSAANRRLRALLTGIIDGYRRAGADHDDLIGTDASYETLSRLPFTRAVITEALPGHRLQQERYAGNILPPDLGRRSSLSVAETVEEPAEDATFPGEGGAGWRCHGPLASDRLVIVCPGDSVNDLGLVEVLGAVDLRHVANQHAVTHDLGLEARGTVGIPLGFAAAGQRYANAELAHATPEKVSVNATVTKGIDHPAGPEFVHARKLALVSE
jgi:hypothetical protein